MSELQLLLQSFPDPPDTLVTASSSSSLIGGSSSSLLGSSSGGQSAKTIPIGETAGGAQVKVQQTGLVGEELSLLESSIQREAQGEERNRLTNILITKPILSVERALDSIYNKMRPEYANNTILALKMQIKGSKETFATIDKHFVDFGDELMTLGKEYTDEVTVNLIVGSKAKFHVSPWMNDNSGNVLFSVSPMEGIMKRKTPLTFNFKVKINSRLVNLGFVVVIALENGINYHVIVKCSRNEKRS